MNRVLAGFSVAMINRGFQYGNLTITLYPILYQTSNLQQLLRHDAKYGFYADYLMFSIIHVDKRNI